MFITIKASEVLDKFHVTKFIAVTTALSRYGKKEL